MSPKWQNLSSNSRFAHKSYIQWVPISPVACIISATSLNKPGALSFHLFNAVATSSILMQSAGSSSTPADILWSHSFSSFISLLCTPSTHTHTTVLRPFWILSETTRVIRHEKGKPNLDLLDQAIVSGSGISWAICKSATWPRCITTPASHHSVFYRLDALPVAQRTSSKHWKGKCKEYIILCTPSTNLWSLSSFLFTITLPDTPFRQFDPVISCLSFTISLLFVKFPFDA